MTQVTRIVGHSVPRMDAPGKVTGTALYAADFALPGMLYGKVLRSCEPHARLVRIDTSRATRLPGVRAVITATDVPDVRYGGSVKDERVFARERIRFAGQPLAAVAATSLDAATAALAAIEVVATPLAPGHGVVEHSASLRDPDDSGRDTAAATLQGANHRARDRRRLRRQAAHRDGTLRRAARDE